MSEMLSLLFLMKTTKLTSSTARSSMMPQRSGGEIIIGRLYEKENDSMFLWNDELQQNYTTNNPGSEETCVDFGQVPDDLQVREDWSAEVTRFIRTLTHRGYQFQVAIYDGSSGLCPLYTVRLDKMDFNGPTPIDLPSLERAVKSLCFPGQTTEIREHALGIRVLPEDINLAAFLTHLSS